MRAIWQYGLSAFRDWASWRKLEPSLRAAIANRDLNLAAWYCDRYRIAAVTPAITSIILEMKATTVLGVSELARIKRAWRGASRAHLSSLTAPTKYFQAAAFGFPLAALAAIAVDLAQYFQDPLRFMPVESRVASNLPFLIVALSISVLCCLFQQCVEARAHELKRVIDDLATDLIISFLDNGKKFATNPYQAGAWMQPNEIQRAALATPEGVPD